MAADSTHDPASDADADAPRDEAVPEQRRSPGSALLKQAGALPSVESSLDAFIAKANEKLLDLADFDPATRERALERERDELTQQLAEARALLADARDAATRTEAPSRRGSRWPGLIAAFVSGGAAVFAALAWMPQDRPEAAPARSPAPAVEPVVRTTVPEPAATPAPTPALEPAPAPTPTPPPTSTPAASPSPAAVSEPVPKKRPPPRKQSADPKPKGDEDLYNPF
jgi:hypothetical protein